MVEEAAAASASMQDQAANLAATVAVFKLAQGAHSGMVGKVQVVAEKKATVTAKPAQKKLSNQPSRSAPAPKQVASQEQDWEEF